MSYLIWKILYVLALLLAVSWMDIKTGRISNLFWLGFIPVSRFVSLILARSSEYSYWVQLAFSAFTATALALLFFKLGFFGGADMKAILSISLVFPTQVRPILSPTSASVWLPLSALINASLISALVSSTTQAHRGHLYRKGGKTPFLPVLTLGFAVALVIGDPFTTVVKRLLSIP